MQPMGEIKASNRFNVQRQLGGEWAVLDRVNGDLVSVYKDVEDAKADVARRNNPDGQ